MKITFYDDSLVCGGHEDKTISVIKSLLNNDFIINIIYCNNNLLFKNKINSIDSKNLHIFPITAFSKRFGLLLLPFELAQIRFISNLLNEIDSDLYIVVAGGIEICLKGLFAGKQAGKKVIYYIPQAYSASDLGAKFAFFRDLIHRYLYGKISTFITVCETMSYLLQKQGVKKENIYVVYNGIDSISLHLKPKIASRIKYNLDEDKYIIAHIGRIEFSIKRQDYLLDIIYEHRNKLEGVHLIFVGDGPEKNILLKRIAKLSPSNVSWIPWQTDMSDLYSAIDMVILPSKIEGLPLVMLESMHFGLPFIGSNVGGMHEVLPSHWLFEYNDADQIISTINRVRNTNNNNILIENKKLIETKYTNEIMGNKFIETLTNINLI